MASAATGPSGRERFVALLGQLAARPGRNTTPWPGLRCFRSPKPTVPDPAVYTPSICIVAQGAKEFRLGEHRFRYDAFQYLAIGAAMPVSARVVEASAERPFLSMILDIGTSEVRDLLLDMEPDPRSARWEGAPPLRVSPLDARLLDAVIRFLEAVRDPLDRRILGPAAYREIVYLALRGDQGDQLRQALRHDRRSPGVARAAGMSVSSLHHGFKSVTALSPIQYVKRIRLDRARQMMVDEGFQAAEVALRVGYESPSQFSREFKRLFGMPPRRYRESRPSGAA